MKTISFSYRLGLSTVYQIIIEVCYAIIKIVMPEVMLVPTEQKWKEIASEFWTCWNFPNCLGAIDGKHVTIQASPNSGSQYFCYKKTFSIVLLALVDTHYNFIAVDVGSFGKNSDGGIMAHSKLGKALDQNKLNVPPKEALPGTTNDVPYVIVGDEAFPLKTYLLRPYPGKQLDCNEKRVYNYRLYRARRVVENAFGLLSQKFRIYNRRMQAKPENADTSDFSICTDNNKDNKAKVDDTKKRHPCAENDAAVKINEREAIEKLQVEHEAIVLDLQMQHQAEVKNLHLYYEFRIGELHMNHGMMVSTLQRNHEILVGHLRSLNYTQGIRQEAALRDMRELKNKTLKDHLQEIQSMRLKYDNKLKEYEIAMKGLIEENELLRTEHESVLLDLRETTKVFKVNMKASMECLVTESNAAMEMLRNENRPKMKISSPFLTKQYETKVEGIRRKLAEKKQQRSIIATHLRSTNSHGDNNANNTANTITNDHAIDMVKVQDTMLQETVEDCQKLFYDTVRM
ncbi:hypothetical protein QTP88_020932 [Uroleucon formosanum]